MSRAQKKLGLKRPKIWKRNITICFKIKFIHKDIITLSISSDKLRKKRFRWEICFNSPKIFMNYGKDDILWLLIWTIMASGFAYKSQCLLFFFTKLFGWIKMGDHQIFRRKHLLLEIKCPFNKVIKRIYLCSSRPLFVRWILL